MNACKNIFFDKEYDRINPCLINISEYYMLLISKDVSRAYHINDTEVKEIKLVDFITNIHLTTEEMNLITGY